MTDKNDLKPGDVVQHPEKGHGLVGISKQVLHLSLDGFLLADSDLTGWERVETCTADAVRILEDYQQIVSKSAGVVVRDAVVMMTTAAYGSYRGREAVKPGHVQVRVDDLDPQTLSEWSQWAGCDPAETALLRVGCASIARQVGQGDPTADEPEIVGGGCECWVTPEHTWTTHYGAVEPGSQSEYNPRCPKHGEKPTSATVTLFCPVEGCGEPVEVGVHLWALKNVRDCYVTSECRGHRCKPAQPDEPTVTRNLGGRVGLFRHPDVPGDMQHRDLSGDGWRRTRCLVDMTHHFVLDHGDSFETICPDGTVTPQPDAQPAQPAQPAEPTEFGARVTVTMADGSSEKWCRLGQHSPTPWLGEGYSVPGEGWDLLCRRGAVSLGWGDES